MQLNLYENLQLFTELGIRNAFINVDYFLNRRHNYEIAFDSAISFFT